MAIFLSRSAAASHLVSIKLTPYCMSAYRSLNCTYLPDRSLRSEFVRSSGILRRHRMSGCVFPKWLLYPIWFGGSTFLLSRFWARYWPRSFPLVFPWCSALRGYGVHSTCYGLCPVWGLTWGKYVTNFREPVLLQSFLRTVCTVKCSLLSSTDRFLMSEYLTLSEPEVRKVL